MITKIKVVFLFLIILFFTVSETGFSESDQNSEKKFSIKIKAKVTVLGPEITLGDIGYVVVTDRTKRKRLLAVRICDAPPPGESTEISLRHIKRCLKTAGFSEYISSLKGPRNIRVITAEIEIDKAFLKEEFAALY